MSMKLQHSAVVAFACLSDALVSATVLRGKSLETRAASIDVDYAAQCHMKVRRHVRSAGRVQNQDEIVNKDGFWLVGCEKDTMYEGVPEMLQHINVSVVHYKDEILKEDRELVTPEVCFEFCRSKPDMGYFGLIHGRDCYCTPYFQNEASDDSLCDSVCEGDKTQMCGSMIKSSVYQMHVCGQEVVVDRVKDQAAAAKTIAGNLTTAAQEVLSMLGPFQTTLTEYQKMFGQAGDHEASNLMQRAVEATGALKWAATEAETAASSANDDISQAEALPANPTSQETRKVFRLNEKLKTFEGMVDAEAKRFDTTLAKYEVRGARVNASSQYYPVLYFAEQKENQDKPTTCTGTIIGEKYAEDADACASACDAEIHSCVGYTLVGNICFLLSDFKKAMFFMKCPASVDPMATCMAKLSKFEGTTLKPDPSRECKQCLETLTQADRCYKSTGQTRQTRRR